jgi:CheY-like chemotaxis protein
MESLGGGKSAKYAYDPYCRGRRFDSIHGRGSLKGGFETAIAPSAEEALTLIKGRVMNYRALVTDINLKGHMTGWEVAKQARQIEPEFPIIYMTGAAARDWTSHGVPNSTLLVKPFVPAQLVTAVSQLLIVGNPNG